MKFRINRKRWLRGTVNSFLWNDNVQRGCCLGHIIKQATKCTWDKLHFLESPTYYNINKNHGLEFLLEKHNDNYDNSELAIEAMIINDYVDLSDKEREEKLISLFKKHKVTIEFYN